jgi:hypothetical protein
MAFVTELLRTVFGKPERDATAFASVIDAQGKAACGPYPQAVADALFEAAQRQIAAAGHRLLITRDTAEAGPSACDLCGTPAPKTEVLLRGKAACLCGTCVLAIMRASETSQQETFRHACVALDWHFAGIARNRLVTTSREFPGHMRPDVQAAVDKLLASPLRFFGLHEEYRYQTLTFAGLTTEGRNALAIAPPQYHDVDVGETAPVKCLHNGLWLCRTDGLRYAVLLCFHREYDREATTRIEITVPDGAEGEAFVQRCFTELEKAVHAARSYRGKILSLDGGADYRGRSRGVMVHRRDPARADLKAARSQRPRLCRQP